MNIDDEAELVERQLGEALVEKDAGVVDQDVDTSPFGDRP
jgi:hypothetical protein